MKTLLLQQAIRPIPEDDTAEEPFVHNLVDLAVYSTNNGKWICQCEEFGYVKNSDGTMLNSIRHGHYRHVRRVRKASEAVSESERSSE